MLVNRFPVRIEWADCDPAGIVFYPRYFEMFDSATNRLFEAAGWKKRDLLSQFDALGIPMVDTRARFTLPSSFGDDIVIESHIAAFRNSSFDVEHRALKSIDGEERLAIEAWETRVWVGRHPDDPKRLKSRPIPQLVVERLSGRGVAAHGG
ncbi:MAG: acyl-CoA thioesterase [Bradyrhizobium sp.]|nr:MAG: acyl-CoA thioesterase [Bradyrhizobium sp.]